MRGLSLLLGSWIALAGGAAAAAPIKGQVTLPSELKSGRKYPGYWRLENGVVPVQGGSGRGDTVVVVSGPKGQAPSAKTVTVEIVGLQASPSTVVVAEGSVVEFKNGDKTHHDLSIPDQTSVMPLERLPTGGIRRQKFAKAGGYAVRSAEHPHLVVSVIVVSSPYFAVVDDKGGFKMPEADGGNGKLKVWSQGRWVHEQDIEIGAKSGELAIVVSSSGKGASD